MTKIKGNTSVIKKFVKDIITDLEKRNEQLRGTIKEYENEVLILEDANTTLREKVFYLKRDIERFEKQIKEVK